MDKKEKKKNDAQGTLVTAFIVVVVTIGFIGGFVLAGDLKERIYRANNNEKTTNISDDIYIAGGTTNKTLGFDEKYVDSNKWKYGYFENKSLCLFFFNIKLNFLH